MKLIRKGNKNIQTKSKTSILIELINPTHLTAVFNPGKSREHGRLESRSAAARQDPGGTAGLQDLLPPLPWRQSSQDAVVLSHVLSGLYRVLPSE